VQFDGLQSFLQGSLALPSESTTFAVFQDEGTNNSCCTGIFFSAPGCNGMGTKVGPPVPPSTANASLLTIDWSGSPDSGADDLRGRQVVAAVLYNSSGSFSFADGCLESSEAPAGAPGSSFMVGSRGNEDERFFRGQLSELLVFPRALNDSELAATEAYLSTKWPRPPSPGPLRCGGAPPNCTLPQPLAGLDARLASFVEGMRAGGFSDSRYELAHALLARASCSAWATRCAGLTSGSIQPLANRLSEQAVDAFYVHSAENLGQGLSTVLEGYRNATGAEQERIYEIWAASS